MLAGGEILTGRQASVQMLCWQISLLQSVSSHATRLRFMTDKIEERLSRMSDLGPKRHSALTAGQPKIQHQTAIVKASFNYSP